MNSLKPLRLRLKQHIEAEAGKLEEVLHRKNHRTENFGESLGELEKAWKLYKALEEETSRPWLWPALLAAVCLLIVTLLATIPRGRFFLTVDLESEALGAVFEESWRFDGEIPTRRISVSSLDRLEAPGLGLYLGSSRRSAFLDTAGDRLSLEHLDLRLLPEAGHDGSPPAPPGRLEIQVQSGQGVQFFLGHCGVTGRVRLNQTVQLQAGDWGSGRPSFKRRETLVFPEPVEFWSVARGEVPVQILLSPTAAWTLHDLRVRRLHFGRERLREAGASSFESAVRQGSVYLPETRKAIRLRPRDRMSIDVTETERLDVRVGRTLKVHFEGRARSALAGPRGFEDELAPTWLEYVYFQEPWAIFWGALVFLWSLGWGLKTVLGR